MPSPINRFFAPIWPCLREFEAWAEPIAKLAVADHVCYRCASREEFDAVRAMFEPDARYIHQSNIAGRRIALVRLAVPLYTTVGLVRVLELSDQKPDGSQKAGFDHIEVYPKSGNVDELCLLVAGYGNVLEKNGKLHHTTYDTRLADGFRVKIEPEPLLETIKKEMK